MFVATLIAPLALLASQEPAAVPTVESRWSAIDELAQPLVDERGLVGFVVGTLIDGEAEVRGYGRVSVEGEAAPDGRTLYEIGSISKTFTGILLAMAAERDEVELGTPVTTLLPEGVSVPEWEAEPIRLVHLASHSSGLPRMPVNFRPADITNPFADYTVELLYEGLAGTQLKYRPGESSEYSNLGAGLLGHALSLAAGQSYGELVRERITDPLGMHDTVIELNDELQARLAPGYKPGGAPAPNWDIPSLAGAGALRSSADDMLVYAAANLRPDSTNFASALRTSHEIRHRFGGGGGIGLGWHWNAEGRMWHNGGTGGYRTMLVLDPQRGAAALVLANTTSDMVDSLGMKVLQVLLGEDVRPFATGEIELERSALERYVGEYRLTDELLFTVALPESGLTVRLTGQPALRLYPSSETLFFIKEVDAQIEFELDGDGPPQALILHQGGAAQRAERIEGK